MVHELKIPRAGESIQEVQIGQWFKQEGQWVERDETVVELETDKASMDLPAPVSGVLTKILKREGDPAEIDETIGLIDESARAEQPVQAEPQPGPLPEPLIIMPAAQRLLTEHGLQGRDVEATGPGGRLLKEDVVRHLEQQKPADTPKVPSQAEEPAPPPAQPPAPEPVEPPAPTVPAPKVSAPKVSAPKAPTTPSPSLANEFDETPEPAGTATAGTAARQEEAVPMSLIRRRIAERLVQAQRDAALLTTFNEIDMSAVMQMRQQYRERFQEKYGCKLGFMSFFTKATIEALKEFPALNAEVRGKEIVYRNYFDIGIAIGSGRGLIVPVLRNAERLSFAEIELAIADFARRARDNALEPHELQGGTFTISNGGVYGSLLSTPIVNPPQSGVLGMHAVQDRPVVVGGEIAVRPMMYVALSYDHRIVDGREAVTFLRRIKEAVEEPARLLLEV